MEAGAIAVGGSASFASNAKSFSIGVDGYDRASIGWTASVGLTDFDDVDKNATDIGAGLSYVASTGGRFTVCPGVGGGYSWWSDSDGTVELNLSALLGSIGVGLGIDVPLESGPVLGLFARPALVVQRTSIELSGTGTVDGEESETDSAFGATLGVGLGLSRAYVTGFAAFSSAEDSETVFGIALGFRLK